MADRRWDEDEAQHVTGQKVSGQTKAPVSAAELAAALKGIDFPASRGDLEQTAKSNDARPKILNYLHQIPEKKYYSPTDVEHEFSHLK